MTADGAEGETAAAEAGVGHHPPAVLNVLHTVRSLRIDGIANVVVRTAGALDRSRIRSFVCAMRREDAFAPALREAGIEPYFLDYHGPASAIRTIRQLMRLIREWRIDVVHVNKTLDFALAGPAARLCGVPVIASVHWLSERDTRGFAANGRIFMVARQLGRGIFEHVVSTRLVAVSEAVRDTHARKPLGIFPVEKVEVVYPGISFAGAPADAATRRRLRAELGVQDVHPVLLNVGRISPVKGQRHLLPMMRRVRERFPSARLLIAGGGEIEAELRRSIAAAGLQDAITLLGPRLDVDDLLTAADVLIMSSESEAAPLPLLEAMRAARPVVATRVGGVPEMVRDGETGYVVPRRDPEALAQAVMRLFEEPGRAEAMGAEARRWGEARFDISISARQLEALYSAVAAQKS